MERVAKRARTTAAANDDDDDDTVSGVGPWSDSDMESQEAEPLEDCPGMMVAMVAVGSVGG